MSHKPGKRRLTWFGNARSGAPEPHDPPVTPKTPGTLGRMWRREPRGPEKTDSWLLREPEPSKAPEAPSPPQAGWDPLPKIPAWPPLPEESQLPPRKAHYDTYGELRGDSSASAQAAPTWGQPVTDSDTAPDSRLDTDAGAGSGAGPDRPNAGSGGSLGALRLRAATLFRRPYMALMVGVGAFVLCSVFSAAAFSAAFFHSQPNTAQRTPGAVSPTSAAASPTAGQATPSVTTTTTVTPGATSTPAAPLTLAFTCKPASVSSGGTAQLCAHTLPGAALSLNVSYSKCRGVKSFRSASHADSSGNYTWSWNVPTTCLPGAMATATVTASSAGQTAPQSTTFKIT
jgi:hypothetical protein